MGLAFAKASASRLPPKPKDDVRAHPFLELRNRLDIGPRQKVCGHLPKPLGSINLP